MGSAQLNRALIELSSLLTLMKGGTVTVFQCDTRLHGKTELRCGGRPLDISNWTWGGRGGTDLTPAFRAVAALRPDAMIVYTDGFIGQFTIPESERIPTMWLMTTGYTVPVKGEVVRVG
jgi:predicted metal-dependent peptidase